MTRLTIILMAGAFLAFSSATSAVMSHRYANEADLSNWEKMASYEPCMNGAVSATGSYRSQIADDKSFGTLGFLASADDRPEPVGKMLSGAEQ